MSIETAKALLERADNEERFWRGGEDFERIYRKAHGLRLEASVHAIAALIERLDAAMPDPKVEAIRCAHCHGTGHAWGSDPNKPCAACGGAGCLR